MFFAFCGKIRGKSTKESTKSFPVRLNFYKFSPYELFANELQSGERVALSVSLKIRIENR